LSYPFPWSSVAISTDLNWGEPDSIPVNPVQNTLVLRIADKYPLAGPVTAYPGVRPDPEKKGSGSKPQKRVWKAYEFRLDFQEQCAMYEQGDNVDPCYIGQVLWSCFYKQIYSTIDEGIIEAMTPKGHKYLTCEPIVLGDVRKAGKTAERTCDYCDWRGVDFDEHYLSVHSSSESINDFGREM
jgi:hypothetical protein